MNLNGYLDSCYPTLVNGWIFDRDAPERRITLNVAVGDDMLGSVVADVFRRDLKESGKGDGASAFTFRFPHSLTMRELRQLNLRVEGADFQFVPGVRWLLQCPPVMATPQLPAGMARRFRRCVLHIGTEKTGTTTLQSFLGSNRGRLIKEGYYPATSLVRNRGSNILNSRALSSYALNNNLLADQGRRAEGIKDAKSLAEFREAVVKELAEELMQAPAHCHTLVLSNEHCHSSLLATHEVEQVRTLLDLWCDSYTVLAYLRPQYQLSMGLFSMQLKTGEYSPRMLISGARPGEPSRRKEYHPFFDYYGLLSRWSSVFGKENVTPRLWQELPNNDVVEDFLGVLGLQDLPYKRPPNLNARLSAQAERFLIGINAALTGRPAVEAEAVRRWLLPRLEGLAGEKARPLRRDVVWFMSRFEEANEDVRREWFPGRAHLFDVDLDAFPKEAPQVAEVPREFYDMLIAAILTDRG